MPTWLSNMGVFLLVLGLSAGIAWFVMAHDVTAKPTQPFNATSVDRSQTTQDEISKITIDRLANLVHERRAIVIDARTAERYQQGHIPGAINLPARQPLTQLPEAVQSYAVILPIVVYCESATCSDSQLIAERLRALGITKVLIFEGGWEQWEQQQALHG